MSFLDLLLAEALAAGMARAAAEARDHPPPDNFFVLPSDPEAWTKLHKSCKEEHMVICVEVTKDSHPPSANVHSLFVELARNISQIPFFQVKTGFGRTYDQLRKDLGGVEIAPTLIIAFFDDDRVHIKQVNGEDKICLGIRSGVIEGFIKEFVDQRMKLKLAERLAEELAGVFVGDLKAERQKKEAQLEYEKKLKQDMEHREKERLENERRQRVIEELLRMDLKTARIPEIKQKMDELKINHCGALYREDLFQLLKSKIPQLKMKLDVLELTDERDSLQKKLQEKDEELRIKDKMISDIRKDDSAGDSPAKIQSLEEELLETRMLYSCTLEDMDIMGVIAKKEEGVVVRVKCTKPGIPNPSRVFAMKIMTNILDTSSLTSVRSKFRNEYDILSGLPPHDNIVKLFAFFYDRPKAYPKLRQCGEGMALCMLMEQLSQNMQEHINSLRKANGPMASKVIQWLKDVICGLQYLYSHCIVHRDMKLENVLMAADGLKIADYGTAICLDLTMKLSFSCTLPRGGNEAHLAPEVLNVRPGPGKFIDYSKQPVWAAGLLAYELAGHNSPFEGGRIDQRSYETSSLPPLKSTYCQTPSRQQSLPSDLTVLVKSMLAFEPENRPTMTETYEKISHM